MQVRTPRNGTFMFGRMALCLAAVALTAVALSGDVQAKAKKQVALKECDCRCAPPDDSWLTSHTEMVLAGESCPADGGASCSANINGTWQDGEVVACQDRSEAQSKPGKPKKTNPWKRNSSAPSRSPGTN